MMRASREVQGLHQACWLTLWLGLLWGNCGAAGPFDQLAVLGNQGQADAAVSPPIFVAVRMPFACRHCLHARMVWMLVLFIEGFLQSLGDFPLLHAHDISWSCQ